MRVIFVQGTAIGNQRRKDYEPVTAMTDSQANDSLQKWRESAPYWEKHSATIRLMFAPLTQALIKDAGIARGQSVLDVAGGPGEPSLTIAERVGPQGFVMCTDPVAAMVAAAKNEASRRAITNIAFHQCAAELLPFQTDTFDVVVSRLGAMFFVDTAAAMREMLRVIKPGGSISLAVWHKSELNPFCYLVGDIMSRYVEPVPEDPNAPGAFRFAGLGSLAGILAKSGAVDVRERVLEFFIQAPISPEEFWELRSQTSETLREKLSRLSPKKIFQVTKEIMEAARDFFPNGQMNFPAQMIVVTGRKSR